jgi:hypothetical protein
MPDLDHFRRSFEAYWRKSYNLAKSDNSDLEFEDATITALAKTLRESGGCPAFSEITKIVNNIEQDKISYPLFMIGNGINISKVFEELRKIERDQFGHVSTKLAVKAAMTLLVKEIGDFGTGEYTNPAIRLAEQFCVNLVDYNFFGRGRNYLVVQRFGGDANKEHDWEQDEKNKLHSKIKNLAEQLINKPVPKSIRAPRKLRQKQPTHKLLSQTLE